jgi:hypothetical protein
MNWEVPILPQFKLIGYIKNAGFERIEQPVVVKNGLPQRRRNRHVVNGAVDFDGLEAGA